MRSTAAQLGPRAFFERLDGRFAERHFDGVKAELGLDTTSDAARYRLWSPSFALDNMAPDPATPLGLKPAMAHFTVGMCCHINFDLACALDETIRELGFADDPAALAEIERGHNFVDTILADQVERSCALLASEMACPMSQKILERGAVKTVGEVSMAMIRRWRAKTFVHALQLCRAPDEAARAAIRADIYRAGARKTVRLFNTLPSLIEGTLSGTWLASSIVAREPYVLARRRARLAPGHHAAVGLHGDPRPPDLDPGDPAGLVPAPDRRRRCSRSTCPRAASRCGSRPAPPHATRWSVRSSACTGCASTARSRSPASRPRCSRCRRSRSSPR